MASSTKFVSIIFLACSLFIQATLADVICEALPANLCSFAVASSGKRCVLETFNNEADNIKFTCTTSEVMVEKLAGYIESDQCVSACSVNRGFVGISSDAFLNSDFIPHLCSPACYQNCPNIVDLYFNLAAGEGVFLPSLCEKHRTSPHRAMTELLSSGAAEAGLVDSSGAEAPASAPAPAPAFF